MKEEAKHRRGFEAYFALGPQRSLGAVARKLGISIVTAKRWSKEFGWQARVADRDEAVADVVRREGTNAAVDRQSRNQQIVQAGIVATARAIADGRIRPTLADLDRLIRLEQLLAGEPDSRAEVVQRDLRGKTTEELKAMLRQELAHLRELGVEEADFELLPEPSEDETP